MSHEDPPTFPLSAFAEPIVNQEALPALRDANIVIGHDVMSGNEFVVFGRDTLRGIANKEPVEDRVIIIEIDQDSGELEALEALMVMHKGSHEDEAG